MKKLFLFTCLSALALTFNSCSDDDSAPANGGTSGSVTMTIDGTQKTYNTVTVSPDDHVVYVTASQDGAADNTVTFSASKGTTGTGVIPGLELVYNGKSAYANSDFNCNVAVNSNGKFKGTFIGSFQIYNEQTGEATDHTITNGSFDISY